MYIPKCICPSVLLSYCPTVRHALPRKPISLQGLSYPRATLRMLRDLMTTEDTKQTEFIK